APPTRNRSASSPAEAWTVSTALTGSGPARERATNAAGSPPGTSRGVNRTPVGRGQVRRSTRKLRHPPPPSPVPPRLPLPGPAPAGGAVGARDPGAAGGDQAVRFGGAAGLAAVPAAVGEAEHLAVAARRGQDGQGPRVGARPGGRAVQGGRGGVQGADAAP